MKDDRPYLQDMVDTARRVKTRLSAVDRAEFDGDTDLQLAITFLLQIIGEAASRVTPTTRERYPSLPWRQIITMRHRLVHDYNRIHIDVVWKTATTRMDEVIEFVEPVIENLNTERGPEIKP